MTTEEWIATALLALGAVVSMLNWAALFNTWRTGRFCSPVPLVGAGFLGVGAILLPDLRSWAWAAVLVDVGTATLLLALPHIAWEAWATSRFNRLAEYVGHQGGTTVRLRLFRRGVFTLRWDIERPPGECWLVGMGTIGTWERAADALVLRIGEKQAVFNPLHGGGDRGWCQVEGFPGYEGSADVSLAGLELKTPGA